MYVSIHTHKEYYNALIRPLRYLGASPRSQCHIRQGSRLSTLRVRPGPIATPTLRKLEAGSDGRGGETRRRANGVTE